MSAPNLHLSESFARFFEAPTRDKLRDVLRDRTGEFDHIDFKREWPERSELARDILGISNTSNGCIIIGVDERDDGTVDVCGIDRLTDKTEIQSSVEKYLPKSVSFAIHDFEYSDSDYPSIQGKKFQVAMIGFDPLKIPLLATAEGSSVRRHHIYVRRDNATTIATHEDVQELIEKRIDATEGSAVGIELNDHLSQLFVLYERKLPSFVSNLIRPFSPWENRSGYFQFIERMIAKKEAVIERLIS